MAWLAYIRSSAIVLASSKRDAVSGSGPVVSGSKPAVSGSGPLVPPTNAAAIETSVRGRVVTRNVNEMVNNSVTVSVQTNECTGWSECDKPRLSHARQLWSDRVVLKLVWLWDGQQHDGESCAALLWRTSLTVFVWTSVQAFALATCLDYLHEWVNKYSYSTNSAAKTAVFVHKQHSVFTCLATAISLLFHQQTRKKYVVWGCLGGFDPRPTAKLNLELT